MSVHYCSGHQLKIYNSSFCRSNQNERLLMALTSNNNSFLIESKYGMGNIIW